jgi:hypothetical protein
MARVAEARGEHSAALDCYRSAIEAVERLRSRVGVDELKSTFVEDKAALYDSAVRLCLSLDDEEMLEQGFRFLELGKSRALADLLSDYLRETLPGSEEGRAARERFKMALDDLAFNRARLRREEADFPTDPSKNDGTRRELRRLSGDVEASEARVADAFRRLQVEDPRFAELQNSEVVNVRELSTLIDETTAVVEYVVSAGQISAIVITREGARLAKDISSMDSAARLLEGLRFQMEKFAFGREFAERELTHLKKGADHYLTGLYDALLRPIEKFVEERNLVIIPHGKLHYAPFHAMKNLFI